MRHFFYRFLILITWITATVYFTSCLTPYVSPVLFWPMSFLALGFPYIASGFLLLLLIWIFIKRKVAAILLIIFFAGFQNLRATIALHFFSDDTTQATHQSLRILTWNVRGFDTPQDEIYSPDSRRMQMFRFIDSVQADVVCLQEFVHMKEEKFYNNIDLLDSMGYRYHYFPSQINSVYTFGSMRHGSAIFSRIPISGNGKTLLGDSSLPEYLLYADFSYRNKPVRVFTGHFKSIHLFRTQMDTLNITPLHGDSSFVYTASQFTKLKVFGQEHAKQAEIAKAEMNKSPFPVVLGMDMNSVPTSYTYHHMQKNLQDAFITKGQGLGPTLDSLPATLRIDYLLVDKKFTIDSYFLKPSHLSDHFPQVIDISWKR
jgi:endonuclease/exonuclease/phosphatase family metal-dependent hydrolase